MSKFADEKVEELNNILVDNGFCIAGNPYASNDKMENLKTFLRKTIADAEKRGEIKAYADMIEELGASIFNEVEGREYCENKIKQLEADNA